MSIVLKNENEVAVFWHPGGPLFAGDTDDHPAGWYATHTVDDEQLFINVTLYWPHTNDPIVDDNVHPLDFTWE
jgi:hypothetical protein